MGKLILYGVDLSPPVRAVKLTLKALGVDYEYKIIDAQNGEHLKAEYLAMNPQHTMPTINDNGYILWESNAIITYLVSKYGTAMNESLYPKDIYKRSKIDQRLNFSNGILFAKLLAMTKPLFNGTLTEFNDEFLSVFNESFEFMELFLKDDPYIAGSNLTVADFSFSAMMQTICLIVNFDQKKYPKISEWLHRLSTTLPYYQELNVKPVEILTQILETKLAENRRAKSIIVDFQGGEHLKDEYLEMNPQHTVPTINDNGFILWESNAIITYLVSKYGQEDDTLYPKDIYKRSKIDQRLHFFNGIFVTNLISIVRPLFLGTATEYNTDAVNGLINGLDFVEIFLKDDPYIGGTTLTIADFSFAAIIETISFFTAITDEKYAKIKEWQRRMDSTLPYYNEINVKPVPNSIKTIEALRARNRQAIEERSK